MVEYIVLKTARDVAKPFVIKHHYSQAFGKASIILGLYKVGEPKLLGVITFGQPSGRLVAQSVIEGGNDRNVFEFLRMCVLDECPCPRTFFMSKAISILKQNFPQVKCLVTYADQTEGHDGTVYKANSWKYVGKTGIKYHYVNIYTGERLNKRIPWDKSRKLGISEAECVIHMGLQKVIEKPKLKYIKSLRKKPTSITSHTS